MGMFDHVEYEADCPSCSMPLTDWQSKEGNCILDILQPFDVTEFHTFCTSCNKMIICTVDAEVVRTVLVKKCDITIKVG